MYRLMFAVLVGLLVLTVSSQTAFSQPEKTEKTEKSAKTDGDKQVVAKTTTTTGPWLVRENVVAVVGLVLLALVLFQLIMLRNSIEKLVEKTGGPS